MTPPADPALEAKLEELRRKSGLRLDSDAVFWHDGRPLEHARIVAALHEGIDRHPESGEYIVRVGREWAYLEVEDTPLVVRGLETHEGFRRLRLSDGTLEPLDGKTLSLGEGDLLYTRARGGTMPARFSRIAFQSLAHDLELDAAGRAFFRDDAGVRHELPRGRPTR